MVLSQIASIGTYSRVGAICQKAARACGGLGVIESYGIKLSVFATCLKFPFHVCERENVYNCVCLGRSARMFETACVSGGLQYALLIEPP